MMFWRFFLALITLMVFTTANTYAERREKARQSKTAYTDLLLVIDSASSEHDTESNKSADTNIIDTSSLKLIHPDALAAAKASTHLTTSLFGDVYHKFSTMNRYMVLAGFLYGLGNLFFLWAVALTYVANVLVVLATASFWSSIISYFLLKETMETHTIVCCFTCLAAIVLIFLASGRCVYIYTYARLYIYIYIYSYIV